MHEFKVEGMTCGGCAARVTKAVQSVDGNAKVEADLRNRTVRVECSADADQIRTALKQAGYPASSAS